MEAALLNEKNKIGLGVSLSLVIGAIIGSGVFMKPGSVLGYAGSSNMAILAWVLGGVLTLAAGLTVAEIGSQIPKNGGLPTYLGEIYGGAWGHMAGWMQTTLYAPATIGALGLFFSSLLVNFFHLDTSLIKWIGIGTVGFLFIINSLGTKYGGWIQAATTVGKLIPVGLIIVFGFAKGDANIFNVIVPHTATGGFGMALVATLFAYDGWLAVTAMGGEMKNPSKMLPKALLFGILTVTAAYVFINIALMHVLPAGKIVELGPNTAATAADMLLGGYGGKVISIGIIVSIFGCLNGNILTGARIPNAMAQRGELPYSNWIGQINEKFETPINALLLVCGMATGYMLLANPDKLTEITVFITFAFYIMTFIGVFIMRKRNKGMQREYSVPLFPVVPIIAIAGALVVLGSSIMNDVVSCALSIGVVLTGLPVYAYMKKKHNRETSPKKVA